MINQGGEEGGGAGGPGLIDQFIVNGREFYVHFTNGFKILNIIDSCYASRTFDADGGPYPGTEIYIVRPWMTGFGGFAHGNSYSVFITTDENNRVGFLDQLTLDYARGYTGQSIIMSSYKLDENRFIDNTQCVLCIGY